MAAGRHLENRPYLRKGSTDLREMLHDDAHLASEPDRKLKSGLELPPAISPALVTLVPGTAVAKDIPAGVPAGDTIIPG